MTISKEQAREWLRGRNLRVTSPRLAVVMALANAGKPMSHGDVLDSLGETDWDQATIYRNLVKLKEVGLAMVVSQAGGVDRYELDLGHEQGHRHPHFVCEDCGQVSCLPIEVASSLKMDGRWASSVAEALVQLRGECPDCRED